MSENEVTAALVVQLVPDLQKCGGECLPRHAGKLAQTLTSTISSPMEGGTGSTCFSRLWM